MNTPPLLIDASGRPFPLDRPLTDGAGGEGIVYSILNDASRVAKVYNKPQDTLKLEKLMAMTALVNPRLITVSAWPTGLLLNARTRQLAGFVMPRMIEFQQIWHLYNPVMRLKSFPRATWAFQVRAAQNLAAAFDEVHKAGCLVGDVNEKNAFVSQQALVRLIDCDSFQVRANGKQYLCEVGVPHYISPELQGKPLGGLVRTENHDRFGLAVLIYQLLFVGRHPYSGLYRGAGDPGYQQLIAEFRFAQGPLARSWSMDPPPNTPTFADIPQEVGMLFRRAFERGSETGARPRPEEWHLALGQLEQSIVECVADPGHKYWRGANKCVWCRLAENGGPEYYFGVAGDASTFAVDEARLQEVVRRLNAASPLEFHYDRQQFARARPPNAEPLPDGLEEHRSITIVLSVAIGFCALAIPLGLIRGFICAIGSLGAVVFGTWLAIHFWLSPWHREYRRRRTVRSHALNELIEIETTWERKVRRYHGDHSELSGTLQKSIADCRGLGSQYQVELQRLTKNAEELARARHLRLYLIADADIPKIGAGRTQILAGNNIITAADIDRDKIFRIKGFGQTLTNNLMAWKAEVLQQFRFDAKTGVSSADQRSLMVRFRTRQNQFIAELDRHLIKLESLAPICRETIQQMVPSLKKAMAVYEQAEADLRLLKAK